MHIRGDAGSLQAQPEKVSIFRFIERSNSDHEEGIFPRRALPASVTRRS
jgi:hypothetical protein